MDTLAPASIHRHTRLRLSTRHATEFIDLTGRLEHLVEESGIGSGVLNVQTLHTTTAIIVNEHEPRLLDDLRALLEYLVPDNGDYRHDVNLATGERANGHSHCRAALLSPSVSLTVTDRRLLLGRWQRVFLVELDGPRDRDVSVIVLGEAAQ